MKNLTRLAKLFDKFIEVGDSFVVVEDIRAIRRKEFSAEDSRPASTGMEIITPYGSYEDTTESFNSFRQRISDIREALKETAVVEKVSRPPVAIVNTNDSPRQDGSRVIQLGEGVHLESTPKSKQPQRATIMVDSSGAKGQLPVEEGWRIVDRENLAIVHPSGGQIARGGMGGTVMSSEFGDHCSGIVFESGKYQLAFKEYDATSAVIHYFVQER